MAVQVKLYFELSFSNKELISLLAHDNRIFKRLFWKHGAEVSLLASYSAV